MQKPTPPEGKSFLTPDVFVRNPATGLKEVDRNASEEYIMLHTYGRPNVYYAVKANRYFKDTHSTVPFDHEEIKALGLPTEAEIAHDRRQAIKKANDAGVAVDFAKLYRDTSPKHIPLSPELEARMVRVNAEDKMIARLNQSAIGKR